MLSKPALSRPRSHDDKSLRGVLATYITSPGWLKYDEGDRKSEAAIISDYIIDKSDFLRALHRCQPNLSWAPGTLKAALQSLASEKASEWQFSPEFERHWVETYQCRIANLCRATVQTIRKGSKAPRWARENLAWAYSDLPLAAQPIVAAPSDVQYYVAWSKELQRAVRTPVKGGPSESSAQILADGPDSGSVVAVWADGYSHPVHEITSLTYKAILSSAASRSTNQRWIGQHSVSHSRLVVTTMTDRSPIAVLQEGGTKCKSICQVMAKSFGNSDEPLESAVNMCIEIGKKYEAATVEREQLYPLRDKMLVEMGAVPAAKRKVLRRPSSSAAELDP